MQTRPRLNFNISARNTCRAFFHKLFLRSWLLLFFWPWVWLWLSLFAFKDFLPTPTFTRGPSKAEWLIQGLYHCFFWNRLLLILFDSSHSSFRKTSQEPIPTRPLHTSHDFEDSSKSLPGWRVPAYPVIPHRATIHMEVSLVTLWAAFCSTTHFLVWVDWNHMPYF